MKLVFEPWRTSGWAKTAFSDARVMWVKSDSQEPAPMAQPLIAPMIGLPNSHMRRKLRGSTRQESMTSAAVSPVTMP